MKNIGPINEDFTRENFRKFTEILVISWLHIKVNARFLKPFWDFIIADQLRNINLYWHNYCEKVVLI